MISVETDNNSQYGHLRHTDSDCETEAPRCFGFLVMMDDHSEESCLKERGAKTACSRQ